MNSDLNGAGIYMIHNKRNGKRYVGRSRYLKYRWYEHRVNLRIDWHYNPHLQNAYNLYGEDAFEFVVLKHFWGYENRGTLDLMLRVWEDLYIDLWWDLGILYNTKPAAFHWRTAVEKVAAKVAWGVQATAVKAAAQKAKREAEEDAVWEAARDSRLRAKRAVEEEEAARESRYVVWTAARERYLATWTANKFWAAEKAKLTEAEAAEAAMSRSDRLWEEAQRRLRAWRRKGPPNEEERLEMSNVRQMFWTRRNSQLRETP